jgi:dihydrolipoamide dehydrogenase
VGKSEQQAKAEGLAVRTGQFPFAINGRALGRTSHGLREDRGRRGNDRVLGMHIIQARASISSRKE